MQRLKFVWESSSCPDSSDTSHHIARSCDPFALSVTTKQASCCSTDHGGGKRRGEGIQYLDGTGRLSAMVALILARAEKGQFPMCFPSAFLGKHRFCKPLLLHEK